MRYSSSSFHVCPIECTISSLNTHIGTHQQRPGLEDAFKSAAQNASHFLLVLVDHVTRQAFCMTMADMFNKQARNG
jgi:hypothetical protein